MAIKLVFFPLEKFPSILSCQSSLLKASYSILNSGRSKNIEGPSLTHQFSSGVSSKHANNIYIFVISLQSLLFIVYFCPQRQYKICFNIGPVNVVGTELRVYLPKPALRGSTTRRTNVFPLGIFFNMLATWTDILLAIVKHNNNYIGNLEPDWIDYSRPGRLCQDGLEGI